MISLMLDGTDRRLAPDQHLNHLKPGDSMRKVAIAAACATLLATVWTSQAAADVGAPSAPTGLAAAPTSGGIRLRWDENPEPHVWQYDVYRRTGSGSWDVTPIVTTWRTDPTDATASIGTSYTYRVVATSANGLSASSTTVTATAGADTSRPARMSAPVVSARAGAVAIKWDAITNDPSVIGYGIQRRVVGDPTFTWYDSFSTDYTRWVDTRVTNGVRYEYQVLAQDAIGWGGASAASAIATPSGTDTTAPATPSGLTGYAGDGEAQLIWTRNAEADVARYELQARRCGYGSYINWGRSERAPRFHANWLTNFAEYCFRIRAVDDSGNASAWSTDARVTPDRASIVLGVDGGSGWNDSSVIALFGRLERPSVRIELDADGDPTSSALARDLGNLTAAGVRPLVLAGYGGTYPTSDAAVARFCGGIASIYGPGGSAGLSDDVAVRYIEFGNESSYTYLGTYTNPARYAELLGVCVDAATAANPFVGVLAIGDDPAWVGWIPAIQTELGTDWEQKLAGLTTHPYGPAYGQPNSSWFYRIQSIMDRDPSGKLPIFATEFGVASTGTGTALTDNYGWPVTARPSDAVTYTGQVLSALRTDYPRTSGLWWFNILDGAADNGVNNNREWFFGLFDSTKTAKRPLTDMFLRYNRQGGYH